VCRTPNEDYIVSHKGKQSKNKICISSDILSHSTSSYIGNIWRKPCTYRVAFSGQSSSSLKVYSVQSFRTQCSLNVPPTLTLKNIVFRAQGVFVCFFRFSECTLVISVNSIRFLWCRNWTLFMLELNLNFVFNLFGAFVIIVVTLSDVHLNDVFFTHLFEVTVYSVLDDRISPPLQDQVKTAFGITGLLDFFHCPVF
jgi:hypothetical protein